MTPGRGKEIMKLRFMHVFSLIIAALLATTNEIRIGSKVWEIRRVFAPARMEPEENLAGNRLRKR